MQIKIASALHMIKYLPLNLLLFGLFLMGCGSNSTETETTNQTVEEMNEQFVFVGTYTRKEGHVDGKAKGIYVLKWDEAGEKLTSLDTLEGLPNPSYVTIHPNGRFLYAANELADGSEAVLGQVSAFAIDPIARKYSSLGTVSAKGDAPCHLMVLPDGSHTVVANYVGGNVAALPINAQGGIEEASGTAQHEGTGPNEGRQGAPHAHMVHPFPNTADAFLAVDLGIDQLIHYKLNKADGQLQKIAHTTTMPGAGPRHLDFHPVGKWVYVLNELNHTIEVFEYKDVMQAFDRLQVISTLPADSDGVSYPAAIKVHPSGKFLYASNRGTTEEENSIAIFTIDQTSGNLTFQSVAHTEGNFPRDFELSPSGKYLLAANQNTDNILIFKVDPENGSLSKTGTNFAIPTPVCLKFLSL